MPNLTRIFSEILSSCPAELRYVLSARMVGLYPDHHVLETEDYDFDPVRFADAGRCILTISPDAHPNVEVEWDHKTEKIRHIPRTAALEVGWKGERLELFSVRYDEYDTVWFVVARSAALAEAFFEAVCRFSTASEGEVLVFDGNWFRRDAALLKALGSAQWDELALPVETKVRLLEDTEGFFSAREEYQKLGVPWKRGLLLTGPPGNGKTHALRAIVSRLGRPVFLVKSFEGEDGKAAGIRKLFGRARTVAPCVIVLEDLDALIDDRCRSALLNELDGFEGNDGILTLATTNHPDRLDTAITKRPSRFDRTIEFGRPAEIERGQLLRRYLGDRISEEEFVKLAKRSEGLSGAALKEAAMSGLMAWSKEPEGSLVKSFLAQLPALPGNGRGKKK